MDLETLLKATATELINALEAIISSTDPGVTDDVFDRRGLTFDDHWPVRVLALDHEDVVILICDLAKAALLSAWFNSLETASAWQPPEQAAIPGVRWRWFFDVYSRTGQRITDVRVSADTETEAIEAASRQIDPDRVLGRAVPYRAAADT